MDRVPAVPTTQIRTDDVLVTRWDFPPGSETGHHRHGYDYVVVPVTNGTLTIETDPGDGSIQATEAELEIGISYTRAAGVAHNVANLTDKPITFIDIELLTPSD